MVNILSFANIDLCCCKRSLLKSVYLNILSDKVKVEKREIKALLLKVEDHVNVRNQVISWYNLQTQSGAGYQAADLVSHLSSARVGKFKCCVVGVHQFNLLSHVCLSRGSWRLFKHIKHQFNTSMYGLEVNLHFKEVISLHSL